MHSSWYSKVFIALIQYLCIAALATAVNALLKAVAVVLGKDKTNAGIYWTRQMHQKEEKKKGERYLKCTKGGGSVAFHRKITITGVMQETKEIIMAIANLKIFPICLSQWFWRQDNRSLLFLFFSLIVHAIMLGTTANNEDESYKSSCEKSLLCFHVVGCRSLFQITIHLILVRDQFETVEIRCVEGDGDKPRV